MIIPNLTLFSFSQNKEENYYSWDFTDCYIKDILYALSMESDVSIVADDTVDGKGDFRFTGEKFDDAFSSFLSSNRLYVKKEDKIWTVSKFRFEEKDNLISVDAYDLYPREIIEKISENVDWVLTYDSLPNQLYSCHFKDLKKNDLVYNLGRMFGNYEINENENGFHIKKQNEYRNDFDFDNSSINIRCNEDFSFSVDIKDCNFNNVVEELFEIYKESNELSENTNYCILSTVDNKVARSVFLGKDFEDTLSKLCSQNGYEYIYGDNIYYITINNQSKTDLINGEKKWNLFSLNYISTREFIPLLEQKFGQLETISLLDNNSFYCKCNETEKELIESFIKDSDIEKSIYLINLKYIKPQELLEFAPPAVDKSNLYLADNNSRLYFNGTEEEYKNLVDKVNIIDEPVKSLTYDLLILQYDETKQNTWASSFGAKSLKMGDRSNISASLGSVMGFNLNVVAAFGVNFAADLQASLEENYSRVYADTTLHGVSGKNISFQNTNTYRYRDNNVNPETGEPIYSGVTREIITGIKIDILGWVSGDGTITSTVTASISRQGIDTSSSSGNPPPTTEKIITTEVSGRSGEPIILSGLILNSGSESEKGTPGLSEIPGVGNLFKNRSKNNEKSQMIIYLVPHLSDFEFETKTQIYNSEWLDGKIDSFIKIIEEKEE